MACLPFVSSGSLHLVHASFPHFIYYYLPPRCSSPSLYSVPCPPDALITGSWDSHLNVYDPRASDPLVASHELPARVYSMDTKANRLVVAMAERNVYVFDVRKLEEPEQKRESALKYMTRKVACMTDGKG